VTSFWNRCWSRNDKSVYFQIKLSYSCPEMELYSYCYLNTPDHPDIVSQSLDINGVCGMYIFSRIKQK
jgi:hypothetical protein